MTTRTELESKIVQLTVTERTGRPIFTALCEDGSAWVRQSYCETRILQDLKFEPFIEPSVWVQLHPPHRAPEVEVVMHKHAYPEVQFDDLVVGQFYWCSDLRRDRTWDIVEIDQSEMGRGKCLTRAGMELDANRKELLQYRYFGPILEPEVKP